MNESSDGGPAFPRQHVIMDENNAFFKPGHNGMSLRDYFASQADVPWEKAIEVLMEQTGRKEFTVREVQKARSELKYYEADAMLTERKGQK